MEKEILKAVKSPLSVIAIFAGISEIAMTVTLLNLSSENQKIFIWFVMLFPILLFSLFFFVLYKKPAVLFSPGDYQDDGAYLSSIGVSKGIEGLNVRIEQIEETLSTVQQYVNTVVEKTIPDQSNDIINKEKKRLEELKFIHSLESNNLYSFLNRELNIKHNDINKIILQCDTAYKLPEEVSKITSNESKGARISSLLQSFPKVITDFNYLKDVLTKGD